MITTEVLCTDISIATTLTEADVNAVLSSEIITFTQLGAKIKLDNLGIFKLAFSGEEKEDKSEITAFNICDVYIFFLHQNQN